MQLICDSAARLSMNLIPVRPEPICVRPLPPYLVYLCRHGLRTSAQVFRLHFQFVSCMTHSIRISTEAPISNASSKFGNPREEAVH